MAGAGKVISLEGVDGDLDVRRSGKGAGVRGKTRCMVISAQAMADQALLVKEKSPRLLTGALAQHRGRPEGRPQTH